MTPVELIASHYGRIRDRLTLEDVRENLETALEQAQRQKVELTDQLEATEELIEELEAELIRLREGDPDLWEGQA